MGMHQATEQLPVIAHAEMQKLVDDHYLAEAVVSA